MSDSVGPSRATRVADFCQYVKDQKEALDKQFAAERERCRLLDEADRKYYEQLAKEQRAALEKQLRDAGSSETGARAGQVLK
jgi:hypothetical protein